MTAQSGLGFSGIVAIQIPEQGDPDQRLTKNTTENYDYDWKDGANTGNPNNVIYVKGSEFVDGSLRLIPDTEHNETGIQFELRAQGVWNVTSIDLLGEAAIALGHSIELGLAGDHLHLFEADGEESIVSNRHFSNLSGSADADESLKVGVLIEDSTVQPDDSGVLSNGGSGAITWTFELGLEKLIRSIWLQAAIVFTVDVEITLRRGSASGGIVHRRKYPASQFVVGVSVEFEIPGWFEIENFDVIWFQVEPLTVGTVSLEADVNNLLPVLALSFCSSSRVPLMNFESGVDAIIYEQVNVGTVGQPIIIYPAILTNEGNQTTVVPSTVVEI